MDSPCLAPCRVVAHAPEPLHGFTKQSVIQRPCRFQVRTYMAFLAPIDLQGQFEKKGWCLRSLHGVPCLFIACDMSCDKGTRTLARPLFLLFSPASTKLFFRCRLFR